MQPASAARTGALKIVHAAGFSHPDPEVVVLLRSWERRLAVFIATMPTWSASFSRRREWGFPDSVWGAYSTDAKNLVSGMPFHVVHGDVKAGSYYAGDERVALPGNRERYKGGEGLAKADAEARGIEREWGPIVLLQQHPWGKPSPTGYKQWFAEHSLFVTSDKSLMPSSERYILRYMHFVGEHNARNDEPGVIALDYEIGVPPDRALLQGGGGVGETTEERVDIALRDSALARFEIDLLRTLREHGASEAATGGRSADWQNASSVLRTLVADWDPATHYTTGSDESHLSSESDRSHLTDFDLAPTRASSAAWRGSRRSSSEQTLHGFVLGVWPAGLQTIALGVGSNLLDRRQTAIRPDLVWEELAPFPGRSPAALTKRLKEWARTPGDDKIQVSVEIARLWLYTLNLPIYRAGIYP